MSYYQVRGHTAYGPWSHRVQDRPFAPCQQSAINYQLTSGIRKELAEACTGSGDDDLDGICDDIDRCRLNGAQGMLDEDADGDHLAAPCDSCDLVPGSFRDYDGDGAADLLEEACDPDEDNDTCRDGVDLAPYWSVLPESYVMRRRDPGCAPSTRVDVVYASADGDPDNDGVPSCRDRDSDNDGVEDYRLGDDGRWKDDDGDGVPDELLDECPLDPNAVKAEDCARFICQEWHFVTGCGAKCSVFTLEFRNLGRPPLIFDRIVDVLGQVIYFEPGTTSTLGTVHEALLAIEDYALGALETMSGAPSLGASASGASGGATVVLVSDEGKDVWEWPLDWNSELVKPGSGHMLALELSDDGLLSLRPATVLGERLAAPARDTDGDSVPDAMDNCICQSNGGQVDSDDDGVGNACDQDVDQDWSVGDSDIALTADCLGLVLGQPMVDDSGEFGEVGPDREEAEFWDLCAVTDFNADGLITIDDLDIVKLAAGFKVGPTAFPAEGDTLAECQ